MNKVSVIAIIVVVVLIAGVGTAASMGAFNAGPRIPDVKFVDFNAPNQITIKQGQPYALKFNIINNEPSSVSGISVKTTYDGQQQFFGVDRPTITFTSAIGASGGRSGEQTVVITGIQNSQQAVESNFTVSLYVGSDVTDSKVIKVRLEK